MGNFLDDLRKKAGQAVHTVGSDVAHIGAAPHQVQINSPQVMQKIQNAKYGVLAQGNNRNVAATQLNNFQRAATPTMGQGFNNLTSEAGKQFLQNFITQPAADIAATVVQHPVTPWAPGGAAGREYLYGQQTFKPVIGGGQNGLYNSSVNHLQHDGNILQRTLAKPLSAADVAFHVANDVPVVGMAAKGIAKGTKMVAPEAAKAIDAAAKQAIPVAKAANKALLTERSAAINRVATKDGAISEVRRLATENKAIQKQQATLPVDNYKAAEVLQRKLDRNTNMQAQIKASLPKTGAVRTVTDKLLTAQPGLTVGGPNALQYMHAKKYGKVFEGVDGKPRFEIDDSGAKIKNPNATTAGDLLHHPELFKQYPHLKDVKVGNGDALRSGEMAHYNDKTNTLELSPAVRNSPELAKKKVLHELQHAVQTTENTARGGSMPNPDVPFSDAGKQFGKHLDEQFKNGEVRRRVIQEAGTEEGVYMNSDELTDKVVNDIKHEWKDKQYRNLAGEAEARAVEKRANLPMSERYIKSEPSYKSLATDGIHKVPELSNKRLESLTPEAIAALKQQGYKGVSNGKRTVRFDEQTLNNANPTGKVFTEYNPASRTGELGPNMTTLDKAAGKKPDELVTVYRGASANQSKLAAGDFITTNKQLAKDYAGGGNVIEEKVPYKNIATDKTEWDGEEYIYHPSTSQPIPKSQPATSLRSTFYDSLDVPKDQLIIRHGDTSPAMSIDKPDYIGKVFKRKDGKTNVTIDGKLQTFDEFTTSTGEKKTRIKLANGDTKAVNGWISDGSWNIKDGAQGQITWLNKQISDEKNPGKRQDLARERYKLEQAVNSQPPANVSIGIDKKQSVDVSKFGWTSKETPKGTELYNRNDKHVATMVSGKNGRITVLDSGGQKIVTGGGDMNKLAHDVAKKHFYASEIPGVTKATAPAVQAPKQYKTVHSTGETKTVDGEPIELVKGVDTFTHKDENGNWVVSEATTGRSLTSGGYPDKHHAIKEARDNIMTLGEDKLKQAIAGAQLSAKKAPVKAKPLTDAEANKVSIDTHKRRIEKYGKNTDPVSQKLVEASKARIAELDSKVTAVPATTPKKQLPSVAQAALKKPASKPLQLKSEVSSSSPRPLSVPKRGRTTIQEAVNHKPLSSEAVASLPKQRITEVKLNTKRLDTTDVAKSHLDKETAQTIEKMSNKDVERIAQSAGMDTKTYTIQQTRQKIAEQLNVRRSAVDLQKQAEAARKAGNTEEAANLLKQSAEQGRISRQQGTDAARQLQARRIIANEIDTPQQRIFKLLDNAGVNPDVYTKRLAEVDFSNADDVTKAYRDLVPAKFGDWMDKYRYTNMLSSPMTHERNIIGNLTGGALIRPITKTLEGAIDTGRALVTGKPRTRTIGEVGSYYKGMTGALPDAAKAFKDVWTGKAANDNPDFDMFQNAPLAKGGIKGAVDTTLSFVTKLMESTDQFGVTAIKGAEIRALTYRSGKGIKVNDIPGRAQDAADYTLFRKKLGGSEQGHLLQAVDFIPQMINQARSAKNPVIRNASKLIYPFVKTPVNVSKQMLEYSPLGIATLPGHIDKTSQIAKATIGTVGMAITGGTLAANNRLTFAAPTDVKQKQKFLAEGKQAYSVKIGNKWVSYQYAHPAISFQLAAVSAVNDSIRNGKMDESTADKVLTGLAHTSRFFIDQSYFKNTQDFLNNVQGSGSIGQQAKTAIASQASNIANQFVPFRAALTWLNNFIDDTQRQPDNAGSAVQQFKQQFESQLPKLSKNVPARLDNLGNPLKKQNPVVNNLTPFKMSTEKTDNNPKLDSLTNEIDRLARQDNGIAFTKQTPTQKIAGTDVNLKPNQTRSLTEAINKQVKDGWNKVMATPEYKTLSDEDKRNALKSLKADETSAAKRQFGANNGIVLKDKPSKSDEAILTGKVDFSAYAKVKNAKGTYSSTSTTTADYNKSPDAEYKAAQTRYNDNKASMNDVQRIKAENGLQRLKIGSTYDKSVRDLYGMSKDEIHSYVTTNPNGNAIAQKLINYDNALYDAGLSTYKKFKTGIAPTSKKSGTTTAKARRQLTTSHNNISGRVAQAKRLSSKTIKAKKVSLSGKISGMKMRTYKAPTLYRKKIA